MKHGSLFSGIGGFDLAAQWMGWDNVFHCEWNEFGQKVLKYYWPGAKSYADITKTDFTIHRGTIDILTGGFPCQPYSQAGKRLGKEDDRHLWPEMLRAIREIQPTFVVGENVRGLTNWNGGMVFDEVQADLEAAGYEVTPFLLPACAVNAPHRRDRIWFVAYSGSNGHKSGGYSENRSTQSEGESIGNKRERERVRDDGGRISKSGTTANTNSHKRCERRLYQTEPETTERHAGPCNARGNGWTAWQNFPTQSPIRLRNDGISSKLERYITNDLQNEISNTSKDNRIENLPEVWAKIQSPEIWEKIRGFYSLDKKEVLFQTMQLYTTGRQKQEQLSPFSQELSKPILLHLRKYKEFRCSPHGRELEKQREKQLDNSLSFLPHEIALAAGIFEAAISKFEAWHRNESIKAGGNAIVPQIAHMIFKAIEEYEKVGH